MSPVVNFNAFITLPTKQFLHCVYFLGLFFTVYTQTSHIVLLHDNKPTVIDEVLRMEATAAISPFIAQDAMYQLTAAVMPRSTAAHLCRSSICKSTLDPDDASLLVVCCGSVVYP